MPTHGTVRIEIAAGIGRVTIDRPHKRNALDGETLAGLTHALQQCTTDRSVRLVQLSGAGDTFCAGVDLDTMRSQLTAGHAANLADAQGLADLLALLDAYPKPTLARVNGNGFGGALGLMAACDIVVAADHAKFAFTEVRLGIIPAVISPFVIAKLGESAARRYFLTAETMTAARLRELGLVHDVVPAAELDARCAALAADLLKGAPGALAQAKILIRDVSRSATDDRAATAAAMAERLANLRVQPEAQEGFNAFFEKRKPTWRLD